MLDRGRAKDTKGGNAMSELPTRPLGTTGYDVSILAIGGVRYNKRSDEEAVRVVNRAIDLGINYIDTAHAYEDSERKIGLATADRREEVFLATKTGRRDYDGAKAEIEQSFRDLQTDHIDLMQVHSLADEEELAQLTGPDGALKAMEEYVDDGSIGHVSVTGHTTPHILAKAMGEYPFSTLLVSIGAMNAAVYPFYDTILPVASAARSAC